MAWPVRVQVVWKIGGGWGAHGWISILGRMNGGQSAYGKTDDGGYEGLIIQWRCSQNENPDEIIMDSIMGRLVK
jgi:hypothetical protein